MPGKRGSRKKPPRGRATEKQPKADRKPKATARPSPTKGRAAKASTSASRSARPRKATAPSGGGQTGIRGTDATVTLIVRDPETAFATWELASAPDTDRAVLRVVRGDAVEREVSVSLQTRGTSIKDLAPGEQYRVELSVGDGEAGVSLGTSNAVVLPPRGPSPIERDRFVQLGAPEPRPEASEPGDGFASERRDELLSLSTPKRPAPSSKGAARVLSGRG